MNNKAYNKISKAYKFFCDAEKAQLRFTLDDIVAAAGWSMQTVIAYKQKKWHKFLFEDKGKFFCEGLLKYSERSFSSLHSQRIDIDIQNLRPRFGQHVDALIDKARESALLAVQVYNNPLTTFRTPGYLVLMNIAFTALFHAIFERDNIDYYYKNPDGTPKRIIDGGPAVWELSTRADHYYKGANNAERINLKFLTELRNKIEHRFLPVLNAKVAGQCQAMLFNFEELISKEFDSFFALGSSLALSLQLSEIASAQRDTLRRFQTKEYDNIRQYVDSFQENLPQDIMQSQKYSFRVFLIPRLGNHASSSDVAIEFVHYDPTKPEEMKQYERQVAMIKDRVVNVQVANQGKLKPSTVIQLVKKATGMDFTSHHHISAWKLYKIRPGPEACNTDFCQYDEPHKDYVYTEKWVQFLTEKVSNPEEFDKIKRYKEPKQEVKSADVLVTTSGRRIVF